MPENTVVKRTFEDDGDKFERKEFAQKLTRVITRYTPLYDEAFVLSLNAPWGSGKTTFLDMWQSDLETPDDPYDVIRINAWETDFDEEPLIPIISAIYTHVSKTDISEELKKSILEVLGITALGINDVIAHGTGVNFRKLFSESEKENRQLQEVGEDLYKEYSFKNSAYKELRKALDIYVSGLRQKPLVIFVDELDRVRPDYAVKFLEAIKHIFSAKGVCFVLAVDKTQLEKSVKQLYGDIDFPNYYRRFVTREANLSRMDKINLRPFIYKKMEWALDGKHEFNFPMKDGDRSMLIDFMESICKCFDFSAREIEDWIRIFVHYIVVEDGQLMVLSYIEASAFLIAISMRDEPKGIYSQVGGGNIPPRELVKYIKNLNYSWQWRDIGFEQDLIALSLTCLVEELHGIENGYQNELLDTWCGAIARDKLPEDEAEIRSAALREIKSYIGKRFLPSRKRFQSIYENLEAWSSLTK